MITITYFVTRFRRQYVTSGTSSNSLRAIFKSLSEDIHLKNTWELVWVVEGNLCKMPLNR